MRSMGKCLALVGLLAAFGCGERDVAEREAPERDVADAGIEAPGPGAPADGSSAGAERSITVYFTRDEEPVPVEREVAVPTPSVAPSVAMLELVRGPTQEEEERGISSWFSAETAHLLRSVSFGGDGHVIVDFHDLRGVIPGAASSTGSALLLAELNETLFQFPDVRSAEYTIEGSCDAFWNWLQYECQVVTRREDG